MSQSVRISKASRAKLRFIAEQLDLSAQDALNMAIDFFYRDCFLDACNRCYGRLMNDPAAAKSEFKERKCWDGTVNDGLGDV